MTADLRAKVKISDQELLSRFTVRVAREGLDDLVTRVAVAFDEDADGEFALFVTAVVSGDVDEGDSARLVNLAHSLHDVARGLGLPIPWYVRVQGDDAAVEDD